MGDCKHYNQGYCYYFSDNRTKEFCENMCENNCGEEVEDDICIASVNGQCIHAMEYGGLDCCGTDEEKAKCMVFTEVE